LNIPEIIAIEGRETNIQLRNTRPEKHPIHWVFMRILVRFKKSCHRFSGARRLRRFSAAMQNPVEAG
jgi:hypothetical protein